MRRCRQQWRSWVPVSLALVALLLAALAAPAAAAGFAREVDNGHVRVTVDDTDGLAPGQAVKIVVEGLKDTNINMVSVNQCAKRSHNQFEFGADGGFCAERPLSEGHDVQKDDGPFPPGNRRSEISYTVGVGSQPIDDMFEAQRDVTCREGHHCYLVLYVQETNDPDVQVSIPISFGTDGPVPDDGIAPDAASVDGVVTAPLVGAGAVDPAAPAAGPPGGAETGTSGADGTAAPGSGAAAGAMMTGRGATDVVGPRSWPAVGLILAGLLAAAVAAGVWWQHRRSTP